MCKGLWLGKQGLLLGKHWKHLKTAVAGVKKAKWMVVQDEVEEVDRGKVMYAVLLLLFSHYSRVQLFAIPCTAASQSPLSMEFSGQGYWSGLPFPSPGNLPTPEIEPTSPELQADSFPYGIGH